MSRKIFKNKNKEVTERKNIILDILMDNEGEWVHVIDKLKSDFEISASKPTISGDVKKLKAEGYNIEGNNGGYRLTGISNPLNAPVDTQYEMSNADIVTNWWIMHKMQENYV